jgi:exonuclease III
VLLDNKTARRVTTVIQHSDRIILVKVEAMDIIIIQGYMPTTDHNDTEVDELYELIEELMDTQKGRDYMVVIGDWNAMWGKEERKVKLVILD